MPSTFRDFRGRQKSNNADFKTKPFTQSFMQKGQNGALDYLTKSKAVVCVFLTTGVVFEGIITSYDQYTLTIIDSYNVARLLYKDKITTIQPKKNNADNKR